MQDENQAGLFDEPPGVKLKLPGYATFNAIDSERNKIIILDKMAVNHREWLKMARDAARQIAAMTGTVTAEDVRRETEGRNIFPRHHNAYGALFRTADFEFTGHWRNSSVTKQNARAMRVWRLASRSDRD